MALLNAICSSNRVQCQVKETNGVKISELNRRAILAGTTICLLSNPSHATPVSESYDRYSMAGQDQGEHYPALMEPAFDAQ